MADETEVKFCIRCGTALELRESLGRVRPVCPSCGHIHFFDPKVAAAVLIEREGKVLLVRRVMNPEQGKWTVPGGFVDAGEDPREAAKRECLEETGLSVEITDLLDVLFTREHPRSANMVIFYRGRVTGGELQASDDADLVGFFGADELPEIAFGTTRVMLDRWGR
ncbi:MAG: NUDIX hydrolase [Chloroflexi bacterium]|nr:NUDIX hydrolase [Chloroflexota bacterium]